MFYIYAQHVQYAAYSYSNMHVKMSSLVQKLAELNRLASSLATAPNFGSGGHEFESSLWIDSAH
jgi:hypothetical protein